RQSRGRKLVFEPRYRFRVSGSGQHQSQAMKTGIVPDHQDRFDADGYGLEPGVKRLRACQIETLVKIDFGGMAVKAGRDKIKGLARSLRRRAEDELGYEMQLFEGFSHDPSGATSAFVQGPVEIIEV